MPSTKYEIATRLLTRLMSNIPDPDSYESQYQPQTSQDTTIEAVFKMRDDIINTIMKKKMF
jgi:hypothetical protein